jgi:AraC-like DNA-binding protein
MTDTHAFNAAGIPAPTPAGASVRSPFYDSAEPGLGVLNPSAGRRHFRLLRYDPAPELALFVRHYWTVEWDLTDVRSYVQEVVPNPCVNLVIEPGHTFCFTPSTERFAKPLSGQGKVFGVKFRPGGFYPLLQEPLSPLAGLPIPVERIIAATGTELEEELRLRSSEEMVLLLDRLLLAANPRADAETELLHRITADIAGDRELTKVDQLCERFGIEKRTLQRLFNRRVGLSPKWVIRLHRLQEAAETLDRGVQAGSRPTLLHLSHELGYHDQTHFGKDFKTVVGVTPEMYAQGMKR